MVNRKLFQKAIIEYVDNQGCSEQQEQALLDALEYTARSVACTPARKAWIALTDLRSSKQRGISDFSLTLEKRTINEQTQWWATFEADGKLLTAIATLHEND